MRHLSLGTVDALIAKYTSGRGLGFSGEEGVNVLELNLALDRGGHTGEAPGQGGALGQEQTADVRPDPRRARTSSDLAVPA